LISRPCSPGATDPALDHQPRHAGAVEAFRCRTNSDSLCVAGGLDTRGVGQQRHGVAERYIAILGQHPGASSVRTRSGRHIQTWEFPSQFINQPRGYTSTVEFLPQLPHRSRIEDIGYLGRSGRERLHQLVLGMYPAPPQATGNQQEERTVCASAHRSASASRREMPACVEFVLEILAAVGNAYRRPEIKEMWLLFLEVLDCHRNIVPCG
jgi:hypothetical protein